MKTLAMLAACLAVSVLAPSAAQAQSAGEPHRVVIQVSDNDPAKWNLALNNARNLQKALGKDKVEVEIVAYGPGLGMLKADSKVAGRLAQALDGGIELNACENTMRNTKTRKEDMYYGIKYVGSGVVHITQRQRQGWTYLRP